MMRALFLALLLAGCTTLQIDPVDTVVREAASLARAGAAEQKAALAGAQQAFIDSPDTPNRLRLATLLVALPAPLRDDARASELLAPIADASGPSSARFAAFLAGQVAERQRLARESDRVAKEQKALAERERQERDKREEALKQQLEALRSIERGILEREERMGKKPGARQ